MTVREMWQGVKGYDWRAVAVPELQDWEPTQSLSVVIPAFDCQTQLDLTLAALAAQRFPSALFEVVVVDDGSANPLAVPPIAPEATRILRLDRTREWGRARACHAGAQEAQGEILLFLDADMVTHADHLTAHARWHHAVQEAVTLGHKLFVDFGGIDASAVFAAAGQDRLDDLVAGRPQEEHEWVERLIERTNDLTTYSPKMFMAAVGATVGMRADLYREVGGFRTHLRTGEDMEMAYRLMTAGAIFIPERDAKSWHQGAATYMTRAAEIRRLNQPHFTNYVPVAGAFRPWVPGRQYAVPLVRALVQVGETFEQTKACVDAILGSEESDLAVEVCGVPSDETGSLLDAEYQADPRVVLVREQSDSGFPSRFTLFVPPWARLESTSVPAMLDILRTSRTGVVEVDVPDAADGDGVVAMWRTAALHRSRRADEAALPIGGPLFDVTRVASVDVGVTDLRHTPPPGSLKRRPRLGDILERLAAAETELKALRRRHRQLRRRHGQLKRAVASGSGATRRRRAPRALVYQAVRKLFSL